MYEPKILKKKEEEEKKKKLKNGENRESFRILFKNGEKVFVHCGSGKINLWCR